MFHVYHVFNHVCIMCLPCVFHVLQLAAEKGCVDCVELLLQAGALVDIHDAGGDTPLISAAKQVCIH